MANRKELFVCACSSIEHQISFIHDEDENQVYANIHLCKLGLLDRIENGIKYIFGYKSRFGDFEEFIFDVDDVDKLQSIVDSMRNIKDNECR